MSIPIGGLLRAGLGVKIDQIKLAASSYARDRADQGRSIAVGYAVGAGFYLAAGFFVLTAFLVGVLTLFHWLEINYGIFIAFGGCAGALIVLAIICAIIAARQMRPPAANFPSLGSRLRVAIAANPLTTVAAGALAARGSQPSAKSRSRRRDDAIASAKGTARDVLRGSSSPGGQGASTTSKAGYLIAASLIGWALARRSQNAARQKAAQRLPDSA